MNNPDNARLQRLIDRAEIVDCILRYARGVDRLDRELLLSAYHEDAIDNRGSGAQSPAEFADKFWLGQSGRYSCQHFLSNHTFDFDGDTAHVETYWATVLHYTDNRGELITGRYIDRFDRRDGVWKIARRQVLAEWRHSGDASAMPELSHLFARDRTDVSYMRPLEVG